MKYLILTLFIVIVTGKFLIAQTTDADEKDDFISVQTGSVIDDCNSIGIRLFLEYQKDMKGNWQYGISFETSRHFRKGGMEYADWLPTNLNLLSLNYYYKLNPRSKSVIWTAGLGIGGVHVYWDGNNDNDQFGITVNVSFTASIKFSQKIYLECSPSIALLPNRLYYSTMDIESFNNFYAYTFLPLGLKIKL